jgi:hypothetical protein
MPEPKRIRAKRNLTLNPDGVKKLLEVGASLPVPETNLSRLVDDAIAEYVARHLAGGHVGGLVMTRRDPYADRAAVAESLGLGTGVAKVPRQVRKQAQSGSKRKKR